MKDKYLFDNWQQALNHKEQIVNNKSNYYYHETVAVKKKERVVSFLKWKWDEWTDYHNELRFNHHQFNQDIEFADKQINDCVAKVDSRINEYKQVIASAVKAKNDISALQKEVTYLRAQTKSLYDSDSQIKAKIDQAIQEINIFRVIEYNLGDQLRTANNDYQQMQVSSYLI